MSSNASPAPAPPGTSSALKDTIAKLAVPLLALAMLGPWATSAMALVGGIAVALTLGNPWPAKVSALQKRALTWSVVGLGAGMNLFVVGKVGLHGLGYTAIGIGAALFLGWFIGKRIGVAKDTSLLVSVGTAICGGSAIAAVAPAIRAKDEDVSVALVSVFLLNAIALVIFPSIGHALHMSEDAFGLWSALAIHDTSSVVGAATTYGTRALEVATAAKLARALWIVPVTFAIAAKRARDLPDDAGPTAAPKRPWFIAGFLLVAAIVTYVPPT
ncbi:MAG: putative sulfate exporter family transporter, partial [Deltaproteobacteria bacterium]|nr:putative sulfate exporter family transporter [Deltaproteobacteria bacterium]